MKRIVSLAVTTELGRLRKGLLGFVVALARTKQGVATQVPEAGTQLGGRSLVESLELLVGELGLPCSQPALGAL
jgi:hypothetical protein